MSILLFSRIGFLHQLLIEKISFREGKKNVYFLSLLLCISNVLPSYSMPFSVSSQHIYALSKYGMISNNSIGISVGALGV